MVSAKIEHVRDDIIILKPVYTETGDATQVYLKDLSSFIDPRIIKSAVKALVRSYAIDLKAQRQMLGSHLGRKAVMPFYLGNNRVFVPIKMRNVIVESDPTYGYLDVLYLSRVEAVEKNRSRVILSNGMELEAYSHQATVLQSQHLGAMVLGLLEKSQEKDETEEILVQSSRMLAQALERISKQLERIENKLSLNRN